MNRFASIVAGLSLAFIGSSATIAATINVPGDYPTIQEAINASSDGDTIQLVQGVYTENINTNGTSITIQGTVVDGSPETIVQRPTDGQPVFEISSGTPTLRGLQILTLFPLGGTGISITGGNPTIDNCYISGHTATGISIGDASGNATITNCTISANSGPYSGGGIYCGQNSNPTISDCTISGNSATNRGGGIYCWGLGITISGCTITGNTAATGGGIYGSAAGSTISNCHITGNTAGAGGGIYFYYFSPTISNCHITGNTANGDGSGWGGGIYCGPYSLPTLTDCHITDNRVNGSFAFAGGGISSSSDHSNPHLIGGTVSGNTNFLGFPANISGKVTQGLRGEQSDLGRIILEDSTVCGTGEYNITGVLIEHRGENHISDCIDEGDVNGDGDVDTNRAAPAWPSVFGRPRGLRGLH